MHEAVKYHHEGVLPWILEAGADVDVVNAAGLTAEAIATKRNHSRLVKLLRRTDHPYVDMRKRRASLRATPRGGSSGGGSGGAAEAPGSAPTTGSS